MQTNSLFKPYITEFNSDFGSMVIVFALVDLLIFHKGPLVLRAGVTAVSFIANSARYVNSRS